MAFHSVRPIGILVALVVVLSGCAGRGDIVSPGLPADSLYPSRTELEKTPFFPQKRYQCGPAALATTLTYSGVSVTPEELIPLVYIPEKKGSFQVEMIAASRRYGRIPYVIEPKLSSLTAELVSGRPVLVLQNLGTDIFPIWHYAVVIGYSLDDNEIVLRSGVTERSTLSARRFNTTWGKGGHWGLVLLQPGDLPAEVDRKRYISAVVAMETISDPETLLAAYQAALSRWPDDVVALFGTANAFHALGRLAKAEAVYLKLLNLYPNQAAALNNLALVQGDSGCIDQAMATVDRGLSAAIGQSASLESMLMQTRLELLKRQAPGSSPMECGSSDKSTRGP